MKHFSILMVCLIMRIQTRICFIFQNQYEEMLSQCYPQGCAGILNPYGWCGGWCFTPNLVGGAVPPLLPVRRHSFLVQSFLLAPDEFFRAQFDGWVLWDGLTPSVDPPNSQVEGVHHPSHHSFPYGLGYPLPCVPSPLENNPC